ncbi:putative Phosphoglycerate mutase [Seiridium cardinale]
MIHTLQTAIRAFGPALKNSKTSGTILATTDLQETSDFACDIGTDAKELRHIIQCEGWPVDLRLVEDGWNIKGSQSRYAPSLAMLKAHAKDTRGFLRRQGEELIKSDEDVHILVSHGCFLHFLTDDWEDWDNVAGTSWKNCGMRSYHFQHLKSDGEGPATNDVTLIKMDESRQRRGKTQPMYPPEQQELLYENSMKTWVH